MKATSGVKSKKREAPFVTQVSSSKRQKTLHEFTSEAESTNATNSLVLKKVISGGQTGADRAGLEIAHKLGLETGGWAPVNYTTSSGKDPSLGTKFGLKELPLEKATKVSVSQMYILRSQRNVDDSDGTVAFRLKASAGTDKTIGYCLSKKWQTVPSSKWQEPTNYKPCLVISDLSLKSEEDNIRNIAIFLRSYGIVTLNVAGHRDSSSAGIPNFGTKVERLLEKSLLRFFE